jgi:hypothetical protein
LRIAIEEEKHFIFSSWWKIMDSLYYINDQFLVETAVVLNPLGNKDLII